MTGKGTRQITPRGTPAVCPPRPLTSRSPRGAPLATGIHLLTPAGLVDLTLGAIVVLGRDATCDIVLDDPLLSRRHARIVINQVGVVLEDLESTNGVYLNGGRVNQAARLHAGDHIVLGTTELSVFVPRGS